MKRREFIAYAGLGAIGVAAVTGLAVTALLPDPAPELCRGWVDPAAPAQIREIAKPIERLTNLKGLGDYLAGVAWIESRGNPRAGSDQGNRARGWFGMRPESARVYELGLSPGALKDPRSAVALATWYLHRCLKYAAPGQEVDWLAIRRCWAYPSKTDDVNDPGFRKQLGRGLSCAGVDPDLMFKKAIRWNYNWPGIDAVLAAAGRPRLA